MALTLVDRMTIAISQLGYLPGSPKMATFIAPAEQLDRLPYEFSMYIQVLGNRLKRRQEKHPKWSDKYFRWPYFIDRGMPESSTINYLSGIESPVYTAVFRRIESRWGTFWQADFSSFQTPGIYQIETDYAFSTPFAIDADVYDRLDYGYLQFLYTQRSGIEIPGIRKAEFADDARHDADGSYLPVAGGWNDAGDFRKWLAFTLFNLEGLVNIFKYSHPVFRERIIDEIRWGNLCFHAMINSEGQVYEDVGGGPEREGTNYETDWWWENHPGVTATGSHLSDNLSCSGDERQVRTKYNPWVQFAFVRNQVFASGVLSAAERSNCISLAKRAWDYSQRTGHDGRTLFVGAELNAALELYAAHPAFVNPARIRELTLQLVTLQDAGGEGLGYYFLEKNQSDGFRSIAFNADPAIALVRFLEVKPQGLEDLLPMIVERLRGYIDKFLLADATNNPFGLTPYGVFVNPPLTHEQTFRDAGRGVFVRTFLHPLNSQQVPHGTSSVLMHHAHLLARAGLIMAEDTWIKHSEHLLHWLLGHNPAGLCLITDIGFRHPVPANFVNLKIPYAPVAGFIGWFDDSPYIETSNAVEWSTQEIWDVPFYNAIAAVTAIRRYYADFVRK